MGGEEGECGSFGFGAFECGECELRESGEWHEIGSYMEQWLFY
jgi:hypothetical protein